MGGGVCVCMCVHALYVCVCAFYHFISETTRFHYQVVFLMDANRICSSVNISSLPSYIRGWCSSLYIYC